MLNELALAPFFYKEETGGGGILAVLSNIFIFYSSQFSFHA